MTAFPAGSWGTAVESVEPLNGKAVLLYGLEISVVQNCTDKANPFASLSGSSAE